MRFDTKNGLINPDAPEDAALIKTAERYFRLRDVQDLKNLECLLSQHPAEVLRQGALLMQMANAALDDEGQCLATLVADKGQPIVCRPGCFGCCCQLVLCQPFEAALIKAYLAAHPQALKAFEQAYPLWDAATASLRSGYLKWAKRFYGQGIDDGTHRVDDYHTPCPFLDESRCCSIYRVRPHCCRSSVAVDPTCACPSDSNQRPGKHNLHYSLHTGHHQARKNVLEMLCARYDAPPHPVPMPELVRHFVIPRA